MFLLYVCVICGVISISCLEVKLLVQKWATEQLPSLNDISVTSTQLCGKLLTLRLLGYMNHLIRVIYLR